jgi:hypothetical protein
MNEMKRMRILAAAVIFACAAAVVQASPVEFKQVPADAKWLIHLDIDAARTSPVVQKAFHECTQQCPAFHEKLRHLGKELGLEHRKDLHGITIYAVSFWPHHGVAIVNANWNQQVLKEKAEKAPEHKCLVYGKYHIHTWAAHECCEHLHHVAGVLYKPDVLLLSSGSDLLTSALDVLDGKAANLAGKNSPLAAKVREGTIFLARAEGLDHAPAARHCAILHSIERFDLERGQHEGQWFSQLAVTAESPAVALDLKRVLDGFLAMISLHVHDQPALVDLLHKVESHVDGKTVTASFHESADAVAAQIPAVCKLIVEHIKQRHLHHEHKTHEGHAAACTQPHAKCPATGAACGTKEKQGKKD